jgi:hypothetical protein
LRGHPPHLVGCIPHSRLSCLGSIASDGLRWCTSIRLHRCRLDVHYQRVFERSTSRPRDVAPLGTSLEIFSSNLRVQLQLSIHQTERSPCSTLGSACVGLWCRSSRLISRRLINAHHLLCTVVLAMPLELYNMGPSTRCRHGVRPRETYVTLLGQCPGRRQRR